MPVLVSPNRLKPTAPTSDGESPERLHPLNDAERPRTLHRQKQQKYSSASPWQSQRQHGQCFTHELVQAEYVRTKKRGYCQRQEVSRAPFFPVGFCLSRRMMRNSESSLFTQEAGMVLIVPVKAIGSSAELVQQFCISWLSRLVAIRRRKAVLTRGRARKNLLVKQDDSKASSGHRPPLQVSACEPLGRSRPRRTEFAIPQGKLCCSRQLDG